MRLRSAASPINFQALEPDYSGVSHLECSLGLEDGSALLADVGLDVGMLPLDVLPDVGEGIAVELTDPTLVVLLPIVSATTRGGDPQRESDSSVVY